MVIAVTLLTLAAGFCLFDQDARDGAGHLVPDLCLGMLTVSLAVAPIARLLAVGWAVVPPVALAYVVARHIPDPPPRPALSR